MNVTKSSQKMKNKNLLSIEKNLLSIENNIINERKNVLL